MKQLIGKKVGSQVEIDCPFCEGKHRHKLYAEFKPGRKTCCTKTKEEYGIILIEDKNAEKV